MVPLKLLEFFYTEKAYQILLYLFLHAPQMGKDEQKNLFS